jgi:type II secretory pathway pseudopilin PulG
MKRKISRTWLLSAAAPRSDQAFTRIELLVVVVTIAMLSGLLLTARARPDDNGARMVCINNLRQMGLAAKMYAGDNNDYLTWPNWDGSGSSTKPGWLYTLNVNGVTRIPNPNDTVHFPGDAAWKTGLWYQYVQNPKAYLCPVDIEGPTYKQNQRPNMLSSYLMNAAEAGFPEPENKYQYRTCKITDVWSSACYLMWEPDEYMTPFGLHSSDRNPTEFNDGAVFPMAPPSGSEGLGWMHSVNGDEILTVGGDVKFVTMRQFIADSNTASGRGPGPGGKTYLWWSPFSSDGH